MADEVKQEAGTEQTAPMSEDLEMTIFSIISAVGTARSMYIEAIHLAKDGKFDEAEQMVKDAQDVFVEGHHAHAALIQRAAAGESIDASMLLMHAEDQLMSAEGFGILADEFISVYKKMAGVEEPAA